MLVTEAEALVRALELEIKRIVNQYEEATGLIIDHIYVNRTSIKEIGAKEKSLLNAIECEVRLL
jgi:hypothetical protein